MKFKEIISSMTINVANNQPVINLSRKQLKKMGINTPEELREYILLNPKTLKKKNDNKK